MKEVCKKVRCTVSLMILAFAWMSWLHASVYDPKFICVDSECGVLLESASRGCCGSVVVPVPSDVREASESDCGDCEDLGLNLTVTIKRPTLDHHVVSDLESPHPVPGCFAETGNSLTCILTVARVAHSSALPCVSIHLRSSAIPLIC